MLNIQNIYKNYDDIVKKIGEDVLKDRYEYVYAGMVDFSKSIKADKIIHIDKIILMHALLDYYSDILRLESYHGIKNINRIKAVSYECYWILRRKPIQVIMDGDLSDDKFAFPNEKYVFSRIASYLINESKGIDLEDEEKREVFYNYMDTFYYFLKYRNYDAQMLEIMLMGFQAGVFTAKK